MKIKSIAVGGIVTLVALGVLPGCSGEEAATAGTPVSGTTEPAAPVEADESAIPTDAASDEDSDVEPVSDIEAAVQTVTSALDELGIEYTEPVRAEVGLSGAKAVFDMTINGYSAGINVYPDEAALAAWQEASDSLGGIHVAFDLSALSLNSSDGIANSAEIAPQIADVIGGEAHGV